MGIAAVSSTNKYQLDQNNNVGALDVCADALYQSASLYKGGVERLINVGCVGYECTAAAASVIGKAWAKGLSGIFQDSVEYCSGMADWKKAKADFSTRYCVVLSRKGLHTIHRRSFPERVGAAAGHVANGASKAVASAVSGAGLTMYGVGSICNGANLSVSGDFLNISKVLAAGVNGFLHYASKPAFFCVKTAAKTASFAAAQIVSNPTQLATVGVPLLGAGGFLYLASSDVVNVKNSSDSKAWQVFYGSRAAFWTMLALSVPGITGSVE